MIRQSTRHIMLIQPAEFYANPETMTTNVYQVAEHESRDVILARAVQEWRGFHNMLVDNGVFVTAAKGWAGCPDQLFPNWISTHAGNGMILYPMLNPSRRRERSPEMIGLFENTYDLLHDLRGWEDEDLFIESTGSLVMDRVNKIVYAGLSKRTSPEAVKRWAALMGYEAVIFETRSHTGMPVYHTDLVAWIGTDVAAICVECITPEYRAGVVGKLRESGREIVELTAAQQQSFCGNSLEVVGNGGEHMLVMSDKAFSALTAEQKKIFGKYFSKLLHASIPTIETYGGGSARCLMLELF